LCDKLLIPDIMKRKRILLPHKFQIIGWGMFSLLAALSPGFQLNFLTNRSYIVMHWISNILFAFFLYVIVFRVRLFILKRRLKHEE